jgi:FAD/FMN-containing dehydrogenase
MAVHKTTDTFDESVLGEFRRALRGEILTSESEGYEKARQVYNGMTDRHPAMIVRCVGVSDVLAAVRFVRDNDCLPSVRSGGHSIAGLCISDGGIVIDLSLMKGIWVDPARRTARAEAGVTWGDLDHETQAFGMATPGGVISTTGIAGLTLGGA